MDRAVSLFHWKRNRRRSRGVHSIRLARLGQACGEAGGDDDPGATPEIPPFARYAHSVGMTGGVLSAATDFGATTVAAADSTPAPTHPRVLAWLDGSAILKTRVRVRARMRASNRTRTRTRTRMRIGHDVRRASVTKNSKLKTQNWLCCWLPVAFPARRPHHDFDVRESNLDRRWSQRGDHRPY